MNPDAKGKADGDHFFLDQLLDKLYDFGDGPASKKKLKSQKRKKRKRCEEEEEEEVVAAEDTCRDGEDSRAERLGVSLQQDKPRTGSAPAEQTGPTIRQITQVEVVTFQDPTKKAKTKQTPAPDNMTAVETKEKKHREQPEELTLEKARLEVHRFGITGYKKEQQRVFEQERAIMLGARPPKKEYVNYKLLQQQIKDKKQKVKEEVQPDLKKKKKQNKPRDKKPSSGSGSAPSGQVGRFKNGMLVLSSKEIQKIKGSRGSK
ncbi:40S small subunit processome assembly factor 1 [Centroberyx gerrardi]